jgi:hypothetical protein
MITLWKGSRKQTITAHINESFDYPENIVIKKDKPNRSSIDNCSTFTVEFKERECETSADGCIQYIPCLTIVTVGWDSHKLQAYDI